MSVFLKLSRVGGEETLQAFDEGVLTLELPVSSFKLGSSNEKHYLLTRPSPPPAKAPLLLVLLALLFGVGCTGGDTIEEPDAQVIDAGAPDACNPFHEGCAGCGEPGRGCCLRAAPAPTMYCLADDVVCDPVSVNCVDLGRP